MSLSTKKRNKKINKATSCNKKDINQIKKEKLKLKLNSLDKKILFLKRTIDLQNKILILYQKIENERKNNEIKLINLKEQYKYIIEKYTKKINSLRNNLLKCEKKYINMNTLNENLNNEDIIFQNNKIKLLDELVEYREILSNFSSSIINNTNIINDYSSDEITIKENSFTFNSKLNSESLLNEKYKEEIEINNNVNNIT